MEDGKNRVSGESLEFGSSTHVAGRRLDVSAGDVLEEFRSSLGRHFAQAFDAAQVTTDLPAASQQFFQRRLPMIGVNFKRSNKTGIVSARL